MPLRKTCPYSEFFWSVFSQIQIEYQDFLCKSPYLVQMRGNADQKNSEYGHFSRNVLWATQRFNNKKNHRDKCWFQFSCANLTLIVFSVIFSRFYIYCSQLYSYLLFVLSFGRYRVFSRIFRWLLPCKKVILPRSSLQCKNL